MRSLTQAYSNVNYTYQLNHDTNSQYKEIINLYYVRGLKIYQFFDVTYAVFEGKTCNVEIVE